MVEDGWEFCIAPQNVVEFWVVATRPLEAHGFGMSVSEAREKSERLMATLILLPDPADLIPRWLELCTRYAVRGRHAHDARLVAFMSAHGLIHLLTLNAVDFARYAEINCLPLTGA